MPRLAGLDGLRGAAAMAVLVFHVWLYRDGVPAQVRDGDVTDGALSSLRTALIFFFVLSGFLLARDVARWNADGVGSSIGRYARRRALRILPAYWLSLAGAVALLWGGALEEGIRLPDADRLWVFVVLAQNYFADTVMRLNPVTWTLVVEVAFYALLPLLALARLRLVAVAALLITASLVFNTAADREGWDLVARKTPAPFLGYFGVGLAFAWLAERRPAPRGTAVAGLAVAALWATYLLRVENPGTSPVVGTLQLFPAAVGFGALVWAGTTARGPLTWRPLTELGLVSYGVFLWHLPILLALNRLGDWPAGLLGLATLGLTLPLAIASWRLVERPLLERPLRSRLPWTSSRRSSSASSRA